jgi:peptidoglycan/xylan/chitin deacetylase (PgdA/CDA1 family)
MFSPPATEISTTLGAAAVFGLAAGGFTYASRWPGSRIFGTSLIAPDCPGELALTFDDGPNAIWTPRLLDILGVHGVCATFFLLGSRAAAEPDLVRCVAAAGHLIASHSFSHLNLALTRASRVREEIYRGKQTVEQITGAPVRLFRPPFGARRPIVLRTARELGMTPVMWNAMTSDWREPSADKIAARLSAKIARLDRRGRAANIVLHDGSHNDPAANRAPSVAAADQLIRRHKTTHRFVTLDAWA